MMQKLCTENHIKSIGGAIWIGPETIHIGKIMFVATVFSAANKNRPLERLHVLYDGSVILCCQDWRKEVVIGSLNDSTITEIWNSDRYNWVRSEIYRGSSCNIDLCKRCKLSV